MQADKPSKTVQLDVGIWYNEGSGHIHLAAKNAFVTTVNNDPVSVRGHPNLFGKLAKCLKEAGVPHPKIGGEE